MATQKQNSGKHKQNDCKGGQNNHKEAQNDIKNMQKNHKKTQNNNKKQQNNDYNGNQNNHKDKQKNYKQLLLVSSRTVVLVMWTCLWPRAHCLMDWMLSVSNRPHIVAFHSVYVCVVVFERTNLGGQRSGRHSANLCIFSTVRDGIVGDG